MSDKFNEFMEAHPVGFCKMPPHISRDELLLASPKFQAPESIDLREYCTPTEDQGSKPWCAAYAAANWAENILWRKTDYVQQIDPAWIYAHAKSIDGDPNGDGTTLTAVLEALLARSVFDPVVCKPKVIRRSREALKYALHRFGAVLGGFNVTREWYRVGSTKTYISGRDRLPFLGGHAVLVCGYDPFGVIIQNSWSADWGNYGFAKIMWEEFDRSFMYGSVLSNCLDGLTV